MRIARRADHEHGEVRRRAFSSSLLTRTVPPSRSSSLTPRSARRPQAQACAARIPREQRGLTVTVTCCWHGDHRHGPRDAAITKISMALSAPVPCTLPAALAGPHRIGIPPSVSGEHVQDADDTSSPSCARPASSTTRPPAGRCADEGARPTVHGPSPWVLPALLSTTSSALGHAQRGTSTCRVHPPHR